MLLTVSDVCTCECHNLIRKGHSFITIQGLPVHFCRSYLGKQDGVITLIDEEDEEFETIYLARKTGLSGGWMGFAVAHNLAYGDTLVFELVRSTAFKVCKPV